MAAGRRRLWRLGRRPLAMIGGRVVGHAYGRRRHLTMTCGERENVARRWRGARRHRAAALAPCRPRLEVDEVVVVDAASHWSVSCSADDRSSESSINSGSPALSAARADPVLGVARFPELDYWRLREHRPHGVPLAVVDEAPAAGAPRGPSRRRSWSRRAPASARAEARPRRATRAAASAAAQHHRCRFAHHCCANVRMASLAITAVWMQNCNDQGCTMQQDDRCDSCAPGAGCKACFAL